MSASDGAPATGPAAPATRPADGTPSPFALLARLAELHKAKRSAEVLEVTFRLRIKDCPYATRKTVLIYQSEAHRRRGQFADAERSLRKLLDAATKLPVPLRQAEVVQLVFLLNVHRYLKEGVYQSPRSITTRPASAPAKRATKVSDDNAWKQAKADIGLYRLERVEEALAKVKKSRSVRAFGRKLGAMLKIIDTTRPHLDKKRVDRTAVLVIVTVVGRYEKVVAGPAAKSIERVTKLRKGKLWPRGHMMTLKKKRSAVNAIWSGARDLYIANHELGALATRYSRKHKLLDKTRGAIKGPAARVEKLKRSFVQIDEYVDSSYRIHRLGDPPNDPLSRIPTKVW